MNITAKTRNRRKEAKDEVQLQAMAGRGIVPDVDRDSVPVVTMEHVAAASSAMKGIPVHSPSDDNCHLQAVMIGTGTIQVTH